MISALSIFQRARRPLNVLAGAIFLSLTLVFGSIYGRDTLRNSLAQSRSQLDALRPDLTAKQQDLRNVQAHIEQFRTFRTQGLVGSADREGWVEQLVASRERLQLADTLSYVLKPPQAMTDAVTAGPAAAVVNPDAPATHDLDFELAGIHEQELLDLLQDYRSKVHGRFRVQACNLGATPTGLLAQCTLRFFSLPEAAKPPGT